MKRVQPRWMGGRTQLHERGNRGTPKQDLRTFPPSLDSWWDCRCKHRGAGQTQLKAKVLLSLPGAGAFGVGPSKER